ncbi:MAG TPA: hypothetical protein VGQ37_13370 [Vicinamibacterales bacterium]|jgi:hypothetical protein|nr:hypothetical protein [Vicinamibacterales bacterium]
MRRLMMLFAAVMLFGAGWAYAQIARPVVPVKPTVLSGSDVGFRVEGQRGNVAVGTIVIKVNGEWVEADPNGIVGFRPATE